MVRNKCMCGLQKRCMPGIQWRHPSRMGYLELLHSAGALLLRGVAVHGRRFPAGAIQLRLHSRRLFLRKQVVDLKLDV